MSVILCEMIEDEHASFPHRLVTADTTHKCGRKCPPDHKPEKIVFVICANCDHWIKGDYPTCDCDWRCHAEGTIEESVTNP